jgi:hypothetical protein
LVRAHIRSAFALATAVSLAVPLGHAAPPSELARKYAIDSAQIPTWSGDDLAFFLHGSMGTEVVPERVLHAFMRAYPDLFPTKDLNHLGLIPDPEFGWPIGFSRRNVKHLAGLSAVGINCASCHVAQLNPDSGQRPLRILGTTSHFDVEAFFGAVLVATFRTAQPAEMKKFSAAYLENDFDQETFDREWKAQEPKIIAATKADPFGAKDIRPGELHQIEPAALTIDKEHSPDLAALAQSILQLFHNKRAALHVPDYPPENPPPASGPGRNDAFGLLSAALLNAPHPYAPIKFGLVWNIDQRRWVHWDGNTRSPIARNLLA